MSDDLFRLFEDDDDDEFSLPSHSRSPSRSSSLEDLLQHSEFATPWRKDLRQAGLSLTCGELLILLLLLSAGLFVVVYVFSGNSLLAFLAMFLSFLLLRGLIYIRIYSRHAQFEQHLPALLTTWINGLRAGYSFFQVLEMSARSSTPLAAELKRVVHEIMLGIPMDIAFDHFLERIPDRRLQIINAGIETQREVGGNLALFFEELRRDIQQTNHEMPHPFHKLWPLLPITGGLFMILVQWEVFPGKALSAELNLLIYFFIGFAIILSMESYHRLREMSLPLQNTFATSQSESLTGLMVITGVIMLVIVLLFIYLHTRALPPVVFLGIWLILFCMIMPYPLLTFITLFTILTGLVFLSEDLILAISLTALAGLIFIVIGKLIYVTITPSALPAPQSDDSVLREKMERLTADESSTIHSLEELELAIGITERVIKPIYHRFSQFSFFPSHETLKAQFDATGWSYTFPGSFLLQTLILGCLSGGGTLYLLAHFTDWASLTVLSVMLLAIISGLALPFLRLHAAVTARQTELVRDLPLSLSLLQMCMEAGLGLDTSMGKVYEKWDSPVSSVFGRILREIQLGKRRRDALQSAAQRVNVPSFSELAELLLLADSLGVSLGKVVTSYTHELSYNILTGYRRWVTFYQSLSDFALRYVFWVGLAIWLIALMK